MTPPQIDELGEIPWRWRNLLHWQRVHADSNFEMRRYLRSAVICLRGIVLMLVTISALQVLEILQ